MKRFFFILLFLIPSLTLAQRFGESTLGVDSVWVKYLLIRASGDSMGVEIYNNNRGELVFKNVGSGQAADTTILGHGLVIIGQMSASGTIQGSELWLFDGTYTAKSMPPSGGASDNRTFYHPDKSGTYLVNSTQGPTLDMDITTGRISTYNGIATVSRGIPAEYATVDLTAQSAAITTTTLYAVPSTGAGQYRLSWNAKVTTAATTSSILGALTIVYTDPDGVAQTITCGAQINAGTIATTSVGNSTTTVLLGLPMMLNCKASTNITYAFAYTSVGATPMQYNLHIKVEAL